MLLISVPFLPHDNKFSAYWMRFDGELTLMSTSACFFCRACYGMFFFWLDQEKRNVCSPIPDFKYHGIELKSTLCDDLPYYLISFSIISLLHQHQFYLFDLMWYYRCCFKNTKTKYLKQTLFSTEIITFDTMRTETKFLMKKVKSGKITSLWIKAPNIKKTIGKTNTWTFGNI